MQQQLSEVFSSEQTEAESDRLRVQRRTEAAIQTLRKRELERNQVIEQLNQLDTKLQHDNTPPESNKMIPSTSRSVPPQQVTRSEFSAPTPFAFHVITERQKRTFITDAINLTASLICNSTSSLPFETHSNFFFNPSLENTMTLFLIYSI